ncbi:MAG: hypothetical protein ACTFAL_03625 [Candidatus Electronema sp. V4]|uniref:hypothetical protein n=1 Tax=Candidatus Electronema sp. V4 TaxID=3454756 RepID=UPI0040553DA1
MASFNDFTNVLLKEVKGLARQILNDFEDHAVGDTEAFIDKGRDKLLRWTKLLATGDLTRQDFIDLLEAQKDLCELHLLTQQVRVLTTLDRFRKGLLNLVADTAFKVFLPAS